MSTIAFDRIEGIESMEGVSYRANDFIDFNDDYFTDMIGVTKPLEEEKHVVRLKIRKGLFPYVDTKPIHETQKIKAKDDEGVEIEVDLYINYELKQLLLSYGDGIKVLSPEFLREEMKEKLQRALKEYES